MRTSSINAHCILEKLCAFRFEVLQVCFNRVHSRGARPRERTILPSVHCLPHVPPSLSAACGRTLQSLFQLRIRVARLHRLRLHALQRNLKASDDALQCQAFISRNLQSSTLSFRNC